MIRQYLAIGFVLCSFVLARAGGKDFWETKPYAEWTDKEVDRLLKNSPWSKAVTVTGGMLSRRGGPMGEGIDRQSGQPYPRTGGTEGVNPGGVEGGANPGGGMRRPEGELGGFSDRSGATVVISWYSRPIREAYVRRMQLRRPEAPKEQLDNMLNYNDTAHFALIIAGLPMGPGNAPADLVQSLRQETYLQKKNKEKIRLSDVVPPAGAGQPLVLRFPREVEGKPALTLEDKEVELITKVAGDTIRTRFKLADMVVNGQLEL